MKNLKDLNVIDLSSKLRQIPRAKSLTPMKVKGTIFPWQRGLCDGVSSEYKIVTASGMEYFLLFDSKWQENLKLSCWKKVRLEGDLDITLMTIKINKLLFDNSEPQQLSQALFSKSIKENLNKKFTTWVSAPGGHSGVI